MNISYLFHPCQFPSLELHDYLVQRGALAQGFHAWCFGIAKNLLHGFLPLLLGLHLRVVLLQHLQLQDVAMLGSIVGEVGEKEEVANAMVKFQLWSCVIIRVEIEIGHEEALQVALRLYVVAHG